MYDMANTIEKNGWNEWAKYVLMSLEELKTQQATSEQSINRLELSFIEKMAELVTEIKVIKTKSMQRAAMMSAMVAFLPMLGFVLYNIFK